MEGEKFEGVPCVRCGSTTRYVNCRKCVDCNNKRNTDKINKRKALAAFQGITFDGKPCKKCGGTLRYTKNPSCVQCLNARTNAHYHKNKQELNRQRRMQYPQMRYGVDAEKMLNQQQGKCAICKDILVKYHIDHSHASGLVRGLLCSKCNQGIGLLRENITIFQNAIDYLVVK